MTAVPIHPVILSGGKGTRLWPMSRALYPKQLLCLAGERSMLQETVARVTRPGFAAPTIICNDEHRFIVAEQLRGIGIRPERLVLEPQGRNTAPAAALAALLVAGSEPEALLLMMPSDHVVGRPDAFAAAVAEGAAAAAAGALVTFGIQPTRPETGYGYIKATGDGAVRPVERFVEKPDLATARSYLAEGGYFWNAGIFLFRADRLLAELERFEPAMVAACRAAVAGSAADLDFLRIAAEPFATCPSKSIDYAVMERTERAAVVPVDMAWSDVGAWDALWDLGDKDAAGNRLLGDVIATEARNCYVRSEAGLVAVVGVEDLVVVATDDAVLVAHKDQAQHVKDVVERLEVDGRSEHVTHATVYRPWGCFRRIDHGERHQVKLITVNPGARLSLQMHHHRAEHWVVVQGTARVTRGDDQVLLHENQSTYIPLGVRHRLENPGKLPLVLIEVQSGPYLGEDDIVRFDDTYGRA
jgi:mannose-1-phosphate guanylyltransferase/mannose-6-phosphate isomerase